MSKMFASMKWYSVDILSADTNETDLYKHSKRWDGDTLHVAGGNGWEVRIDPNANINRTCTLRDHVLAFSGKGIYLSCGVMNALGISLSVWDGPYLLIGNAHFYRFTREMNERIEYHVSYERRNDRERFVQQRNAGIWNALLGLAQEWNVEPFAVEVGDASASASA